MENVDENGEQRVRAKTISKKKNKRVGDEVDRLSNLPESLLIQVLLNLPTKDVVKCSVLSSRWRNLWQFVPGLDLNYSDIPELNGFMSFVDGFLGFNSESCIQKFKLRFYWEKDDEPDIARFTRWINTVIDRKVQHLHVSDTRWNDAVVQIPPTVYTCESLVSLKLSSVILANPEFVSLPCLKVIYLYMVQFANELALEMFISACPVLESLTIDRNYFDNVQVLRVRSQSLLSFTYHSQFEDGIDREVTVDAPRLEYLKLNDHETDSFIINNSPSLVKVNINIGFKVMHLRNKFEPNDTQMRNMIHNFLVAISNVKYMEITSDILEVIYDYSRYEPLPLFPNLSFLDVGYKDYKLEMLVIFLGSCPNLKSLVLLSNINIEDGPRPQCLLSSLEFVKLYGMEMKLVSYFLENSPILKKLTLVLVDDSKEILKELLTIPRLSASCQVVIHKALSSLFIR